MGYMASANANKIAEMETLDEDQLDEVVDNLQLTETEQAELAAE